MSYGKRGVTLVEMCIVLALIMIIGTMVTSFCILTNNYSHTVSSDRDAVESIAMLEDALSKWISAFDLDDYTISISSDGSHLEARKTDVADAEYTGYKFEIKDGKINGSLPGDRNINYSVPSIESASFEKNETYKIISCDITYILKNGGNETKTQMTLLRYCRVAAINVETNEDVTPEVTE